MIAGRSAAAVVGGLAALALSGCGVGVTTLAVPVPPPTAPSAPTTVPPPSDLTGSHQAAVAGASTTTAAAIGPGAATISGSVLGPSGPVAGATVEAQRLAGGALAATQALTGPDGSFTIAGVLGGIYRVRAWQAPALDLTTPQTFFLAATDTRQLSMLLTMFTGVEVRTSVAPASVQTGADANLVVAVSSQAVGTDGVVRPQPVAGQSVSVDGGGTWTVGTSDPGSTDGRGDARFQLTCAQPGAAALVVTVAGAVPTPVTSSSCVAPPPPTTTLTPLPGVPPAAGGPTTNPGSTPPTS